MRLLSCETPCLLIRQRSNRCLGNPKLIRKLLPYCAFGLVLVSLDTPAFAYLDGATGSMLVQSVIGGVAAAAMFGRHYLAKAKTALARIFGKGPAARDS